MAEVRERNTDWLHHLSSTIRNGHKPNHQRRPEGSKTASRIHLPSNRGFMDDLTISTTTHVQARWVLTALDDTVNWGRMKFKPNKSKSLVIKKGKVTKRFNLQVQA